LAICRLKVLLHNSDKHQRYDLLPRLISTCACDARLGNWTPTPHCIYLRGKMAFPHIRYAPVARLRVCPVRPPLCQHRPRQLACMSKSQVHQHEQAMTLRASFHITFIQLRRPHEHARLWVSCTRLYLRFTRAPQLMKLTCRAIPC
jgi:hypothetical protein